MARLISLRSNRPELLMSVFLELISLDFMTKCALGSCLILLFLVSSCSEPVRMAELQSVRVITDSDVVREVIVAERDNQLIERRQQTQAELEAMIRAEMLEHRESARRRSFLIRLASMPGFEVTSPADARIVDAVEDCRCAAQESFTSHMVEVKITSGPFNGRRGWVCDDQVRRTIVWP